MDFEYDILPSLTIVYLNAASNSVYITLDWIDRGIR